ncbi:MAG: MarR family transcriptional regulator [Chloroflexi bacterium]|nr:MAG: MarR family transcriptional regulator [Chloroflexota bacterium]
MIANTLLFRYCNNCYYATIRRLQHITTEDREALVQNIKQIRRATLREFVFNIMRAYSDFDFSLPQLATILLLEEEGELTIKQVAEFLGRSVSTTSRLLDQLVERGLVSRREDEHDRRAKRVASTERGRMLIATLEQRRAESQVAVMDYLSDEERADVAKAMALLAEAGKRRRSRAYSGLNTTHGRSDE